METCFKEYLKQIRDKYRTRDTTEYTYRTPFENFLRCIDSACNPHHEGRREKKFGAPDFKVFYSGVKVGYIETKDVGTNLDEELKSEQMQKYCESIDNLILTDYCRFILLRNGEKVLEQSLFTISELDTTQFKLPQERINEFKKLIDSFLTFRSISIRTSEALARELSKKAILIKDIAKEQLEEDRIRYRNGESYSSILDFYQGVEELIHEISDDDCIDAYAQTITYGLFLAKLQCQGDLKREFVEACLPKNIPVIRRIFKDISGSSLPSNLSWIFDEVLELLNSADIKAILEEMDKRGKKDRDPFSHFYEDFLKLYNPIKRENRGVYYTPRPIINYIVKSVEWTLRNNFRKQLGYADENVTVLDPATGTGTFLWLVYLRTLGELKERGLGGLINTKIRNQILKNFYGLEILITPYIIAHLKLSLILKKWHYELGEGERIQVYLTNSLDQGQDHAFIPFMKEINEERRVAHDLIMKKPVLAIIGNPPYFGHSANKGKWIEDLLKNEYARDDGSIDTGYFRVDGKPLGERNPKWLRDDYVKFIRLSQWKIDKSGKGVIGFITNNSYLDNPTFRGMRESLLHSFERIYILNLHGSLKKRDKTPDGTKDGNLFDIQQGNAIAIFVKNPEIKDRRIFYADLYGSREQKYNWLDRNTIYTTEWRELTPHSPFYLFVPFDATLEREYETYWKITDIFKNNVLGFQTHRDHFAIDFQKEELERRISSLLLGTLTDEELRKRYNISDNRDWNLNNARKKLKKYNNWQEPMIQCAYRPFDCRWCYFSNIAMDYPRTLLLENIAHHENLCLGIGRQGIAVQDPIWALVTVADKPIDANIFRRGGVNVFPLWVYTKINNELKRSLNLNDDFIKFFETKYSVKILNEQSNNNRVNEKDLIFYIYSVLHSVKYRSMFKDFLSIDFPKIPFVDDYNKFKDLAELGEELVELHLMKKQLPSNIKFEIPGSNKIDKIRYEDNKIFINNEQFFDGIPENVWNYHIGGYLILENWLKTRKNRELSAQEILEFIQIVEIIKETIKITNEIDKIF